MIAALEVPSCGNRFSNLVKLHLSPTACRFLDRWIYDLRKL